MRLFQIELEEKDDDCPYSYWVRAETPEEAVKFWAANIRSDFADDPDILDGFFPARVIIMEAPPVDGEAGVAEGGLAFGVAE